MSTEETPLLAGRKEPKHSARRFIYSRWQALAGVLFYVSVVGTTYAFGVYSQFLKDNLGFSQSDIDIIAR